MADMYGAVRSNDFRVKDVPAFEKWFANYRFGDNVEVWTHLNGVGGSGDYSGDVSFGGEEQYPNAYPMKAYTDADPCPDIDEADLNVFARELREHLMPEEIFHVVSGGAENLRYVGCSELIIAEDIDTPFFRTYFSDDDDNLLRRRMKESEAS